MNYSNLPDCLWSIIFSFLDRNEIKKYLSSKHLICKVCHNVLTSNLELKYKLFKNIHSYIKKINCSYNFPGSINTPMGLKRSAFIHSNQIDAINCFKKYYFRARLVLDLQFNSIENYNSESDAILLKKNLKKNYKRVVIFNHSFSPNGFMINVIAWNEKI